MSKELHQKLNIILLLANVVLLWLYATERNYYKNHHEFSVILDRAYMDCVKNPENHFEWIENKGVVYIRPIQQDLPKLICQ